MNRSRPFSITFTHDLAVILGLSFLLIVAICLLPTPALPIILRVLYVPFFAGCAQAAASFAGSDHLEKGPEQSLHSMWRAEKQ